MAHSLRRELLAWVLAPLVCAVGADAWLTYQDAERTGLAVQDRLLLGAARSIAEQVQFENGAYEHLIPPAALELFQSTQPDRVYYRVTTGAGRLLSGYTDLAPPGEGMGSTSPYFSDGRMRGMPVRGVALLQPVIGDPSGRPVVVQVAQTLNERQQFTRGLWLRAMGQQLLIVALATVLIVLGLNRALRPLRRLRDQVRARRAGILQPLVVERVPAELQPLVDSLNDYIRRLEAHVDAHDIFIQNAAHQLRTPLAVLGTQIGFAARTTDASAQRESVLAARRTWQQATRLVNQLLALSAADALSEGGGNGARDPSDLAMVARGVLEALAAQAHAKAIDLGLEGVDTPVPVAAPALVLREILTNLVDNAIRYTPEGGVVTVRLMPQAQGAVLEVEDNGPGIPAQLRDKVFERFFRVHDRDSDGSGLGLAIVREFAQRVGAQVALADPASGQGLVVRVAFGRTSLAEG